jgi:hypothetical protein
MNNSFILRIFKNIENIKLAVKIIFFIIYIINEYGILLDILDPYELLRYSDNLFIMEQAFF